MSSETLLRRVFLQESHRPTGATRHFRDGVELSAPSELRIVKYEHDPGCYLFYCDCNGNVMTDTYHDSVHDALAQAEREFTVKSHEWATME